MNALLLWGAAIAAVPAPAEKAVDLCDNKPVLMVVSGPTHDRDRMIAYGKAIADSGLYKKLGAYYLNSPRPLAVFEGSPPPSVGWIAIQKLGRVSPARFTTRPLMLPPFANSSSTSRASASALTTAERVSALLPSARPCTP